MNFKAQAQFIYLYSYSEPRKWKYVDEICMELLNCVL